MNGQEAPTSMGNIFMSQQTPPPQPEMIGNTGLNRQALSDFFLAAAANAGTRQGGGIDFGFGAGAQAYANRLQVQRDETKQFDKQKAEKEEAFLKELRGKYTPESIQAFVESSMQDYSLLKELPRDIVTKDFIGEDGNTYTWSIDPRTGEKKQNLGLVKKQDDSMKSAAAQTAGSRTIKAVSPEDNKLHIYQYNSQTGRYDIDVGIAEMDKGVTYSAFAQKQMEGSYTNANGAFGASDVQLNLANKFEAYNMSQTQKGVAGKGLESLKTVIGGEDKLTEMRYAYDRVKNTEVINNLPPGVASDKDIEIFMKGFPDATSNPEVVANFLRGMSKATRLNGAFEEFKGDWYTRKGSLGGTENGKTFNQAWKQYLNDQHGVEEQSISATQGASATQTATQGVTTQPSSEPKGKRTKEETLKEYGLL